MSNLATIEAKIPQGFLSKPISAANDDIFELAEAFAINCYGRSNTKLETRHVFAPGKYIREFESPGNVFIIGQHHLVDHLFVLQEGAIVISNGTKLVPIVAPFVVMANPGRKVLFTITHSVFLNIYDTEERDIDKIEAMFFQKSETIKRYEQAMLNEVNKCQFGQ